MADIVTTFARLTEPGAVLSIELTSGAIGSGPLVAQPAARARLAAPNKQLNRRMMLTSLSLVESSVAE
jgi:hypothetical protein